jgi:hypothetical protein
VDQNLEKLNALVGKLVGDLGISLGGASILLGESPLLLRGFSEFSAQRQRDRDRCFSCRSCRRSFSLRIQPQPGGFFVGFSRARRMLTGETFNPTFFFGRGRDYQRTETSSPSLLEASLKVKRNNAHGWSSRSGSPQHSRQPRPRRLSLSNMYVVWAFKTARTFKIARIRRPNKRPQTRQIRPYFWVHLDDER